MSNNIEQKLEHLIKKEFIGKKYIKNVQDLQTGLPVLIADFITFLRGLVGSDFPDDELEVKVKTENLIGGSQEVLIANVNLKGDSPLMNSIFFIDIQDKRSLFEITDVWTTVSLNTFTNKSCEAVMSLNESYQREN